MSLLVVEEKFFPLANSLEMATKLLAAARLLHPDTTALLPVSGAVYQHVFDDTLQISSVQLPRTAAMNKR